MSVSHYTSVSQGVNTSAGEVFSFFADLKNVERMCKSIPADKLGLIQQVDFSIDAIKVKIDGIGPRFEIEIIDRVNPSCISYRIKDSQFLKNVQVKFCIEAINDEKCAIQIDMQVELPVFVKMMYGNKIQPALDNAVKFLSCIPFNHLS